MSEWVITPLPPSLDQALPLKPRACQHSSSCQAACSFHPVFPFRGQSQGGAPGPLTFTGIWRATSGPNTCMASTLDPEKSLQPSNVMYIYLQSVKPLDEEASCICSSFKMFCCRGKKGIVGLPGGGVKSRKQASAWESIRPVPTLTGRIGTGRFLMILCYLESSNETPPGSKTHLSEQCAHVACGSPPGHRNMPRRATASLFILAGK